MEFSDECTTILNCYNIEKEDIDIYINNLLVTRCIKNLIITRTFKSYKRELKAHIRLYKLGLFREHTKDADLEENIKLWKEIFYLLIGW